MTSERTSADAPDPQTDSVSRVWRSLVPLFVATSAWGLVTVMLGPLLPSLIARWHIQDAQAGSLFTASFLGQLVGAWFAARNLRLSLLWGAALSSAGTAALAWTGYHDAHIALFCAGLGISAGLTAGNVTAGTATIHRTRMLALFNVSWSLGAIASPALAHLCGPSNTPLFFLVAATLLAIGGISIATLPRSLTRARPAATKAGSRIPLHAVPLALFATTMLLYIGNENALGGWLPSFAERNHAVAQASTIALLYGISELISRLLMAWLLDRISEAVLYRCCLGLLALTLTTLLLTSHPAPKMTTAAALLMGATIGPLYPLIVSFLLERTGSDHPGLGPLFASSSLGGATLPWLTGIISTHFGGLRMGLLVPVAGVLSMLAISPLIAHRVKAR